MTIKKIRFKSAEKDWDDVRCPYCYPFPEVVVMGGHDTLRLRCNPKAKGTPLLIWCNKCGSVWLTGIKARKEPQK